MCFSATASFVAGGALGAAGVVTVREAKTKSRLPLAAMPFLFAVQQTVEGVIWVSASVPWLRAAAAFVYVMFSHVLWPFYVPFAVMSDEPAGRRKTILKGFTVFGAALSLWLFTYVIRGPVSADPSCCGIVYTMITPDLPYGLRAYVFVTCISCLFSSHKFIRVFGLTLIGALSIALWAYREAFYSVWCFFSAVLSFIIYAHLRQGKPTWFTWRRGPNAVP